MSKIIDYIIFIIAWFSSFFFLTLLIYYFYHLTMIQLLGLDKGIEKLVFVFYFSLFTSIVFIYDNIITILKNFKNNLKEVKK